MTRWWRRISLRAKVTGVTVAVLAAGLIAAGIGTVPLLRGALIAQVDTSLTQLSSTNIAQRLFDISVDDGTAQFSVKEPEPRTDYHVAMYGPDGNLLSSAGGLSDDSPKPNFPGKLPPDQAYPDQGSVFSMGSETGVGFRYTYIVVQISGASPLYTQLVALPLDETDSFIRTFFGIFIAVSIATLIVGALLTRLLVTLTFRRFGQVEQTAMAIASGDFSQRLTDIEPSTEVGRLKSAINTMLDRVDASIAQRDATVRQMRRFIGDASHELRTPLVSVRGYAELYRMGAISTPEDTARAMERIEKEAARMGVLVEDLLALARLDERRELHITAIDLRPLARDAALDVGAADPERVVSVTDTTPDTPDAEDTDGSLTLPDAPGPAETGERDHTGTGPRRALGTATGAIARALRRRGRTDQGAATQSLSETAGATQQDTPVTNEPIVLGDENKIRQVIANLLGNARRFSPAGSPIELAVGVDKAAGMGWVAVVDHGEGVPEAIRQQIFERFWRADTSRARETGGSGLGLAIVESIVTALNGKVTVADTPGGGATFRVSFPLAPRSAASGSESAASAGDPDD